MKNGKRIFRATSASLIALIIGLNTAAVAFAFDDALETPLDDLIPKSTQLEIDARKMERAQLKGAYGATLPLVDLSSFEGEESVDLSNRDTEVKEQFSVNLKGYKRPVGTCSSFGLTAALENALHGKVHLSERHLWSLYKKPSAAAAIEAMGKYKGVILEKWWPEERLSPYKGYLDSKRYKAFRTKHLGDDTVSILRALERRKPVYLALNTPKSMYDRDTLIRQDGGVTGGGHAVAVVGYKLDSAAPGGGHLLVKNSWGVECGDRGYQWLPLSWCAMEGNYCVAWSIERARQNK